MQIITDRYQKEMKQHGNPSFPILVSEERLSRYEAGSFLWHWHPEAEMTIVEQGQMLYQVNDKTYLLQQGEALWGNVNVLHTGSMYQNQDCAYTSVTFAPKMIYGYAESCIYQKYVKSIVENDSIPAVHFNMTESWHADAVSGFRKIINLCKEQEDGYELEVQMELLRFWKELFQRCNTESVLLLKDRRNYERIRSILEYIEAHYMEKLSLDEIADVIHLCKSECCRLFKRYMKVSLFEFILEYRIEKSMVCLLNTNYSIAETAGRVGFNDSNYYSKVFARIKGMSPARYRKNIINNQEKNKKSLEKR